MRSLRSILVTGGAGFLGSALVRELLRRIEVEQVVVLDALTYAGKLANLRGPDQDPRFRFVEGDIIDTELVAALLSEHQCSGVMNLAAESHVDRSIKNDTPFISSNVMGVASVLEAARPLKVPVLQCSTDEVYGSVPFPKLFDETNRLRPSSPYSASKASAELLVQAAHVTHGQEVVITRCSNNYGPRQHPEKLIPMIVRHALRDAEIPIYGNGRQIRDWIHVEDCVRGLIASFERGRTNSAYNIGGKTERTNIGVAREVLKILHKPSSLITFVEDRPGHDQRYALDIRRALVALDWRPRIPFRSGFEKVVRQLGHDLRPDQPA